MDPLLEKSDMLISRVNPDFKRYLYHSIKWSNRLIGIKGARGTGKTTMLLQRMLDLGMPSHKAAYFSLDDLYFTEYSLIDTAEKFYKQGGKYLFLDEVHKYSGWAITIKNLYDFYPDLSIVFTGSSIIDIAKEEADLSRRVMMYELNGLSFREYLNFKYNFGFNPIPFDFLINHSVEVRRDFSPDFRPLQYLKDYLKEGYYPFFVEDREGYHHRLQQLIRIVVEYDMAELHDFDVKNSRKMLHLLYILAENVPFKPNISGLAQKCHLHRNSLPSYLNYLERARLIDLLYASGISLSALQKPDKIYLNNPNLAYALSIVQPNIGNLRETFFASQLKVHHTLAYPKKGDFLVDGKFTFEIGGKNKSASQIKGIEHAYIVKDNLEFPVSDTLPLWLFGFLY